MSNMVLEENEREKHKNTVIIEAYDENGNLIEQRKDYNLIVNTGRNLVCQLLAGDSTSNIQYMSIGKGMTFDGEGNPVVALTNTDIADEILRKSIESHAYPLETSVEFTASFYRSEIAEEINELGMLSEDGTLYAHIGFANLDMSLESVIYLIVVKWVVRY